MNRLVLLFSGATAMVLTVMLLTESAPGIEVSIAEAAQIRGGGTSCGNAWEAGSVSCAVGTVLCGQQSESCAGQSATSLVPKSTGTGETRDEIADVDCNVCGGTKCSTANTTTKTKFFACSGGSGGP